LFLKAACLAGLLLSVCAFASGADAPAAPAPLTIGAVRALIVSPHPDDATLATPIAEQVVPGTMYRGDDVRRELTRLLQEFRPTLLMVPHAGDDHPDHCSTHLLVHQALTAAIAAGLRPPRVLHYVLHLPKWPANEPPGAMLAPPVSGAGSSWGWRTLALTADEQARKHRALSAFHSQILVMQDFFAAFDRPNELFIDQEPSPVSPCWCSGDNIAVPINGRP
jgi:LmbE family N-acetylglucosaminyl deacetylase